MNTTQTPPEIDAQLAALWTAASALRQRKQAQRFSLAHQVGIRPRYETKTRRVIDTSDAELLALVQRLTETAVGYKAREATEALAKWDAILDAIEANRAEAAPLEAEFATRNWSRFFLVNNAGGHIHSSMHCSTCHPTTEFGWLPELSGLTEKEAVDAHGPLLCSVCYPSAPVEWTMGAPKDEEGLCPGSRTTDYDYSTFRQTSYTGNGRATCSHCSQQVPAGNRGNLRKHKAVA